jgi:hypothetical protein
MNDFVPLITLSPCLPIFLFGRADLFRDDSLLKTNLILRS